MLLYFISFSYLATCPCACSDPKSRASEPTRHKPSSWHASVSVPCVPTITIVFSHFVLYPRLAIVRVFCEPISLVLGILTQIVDEKVASDIEILGFVYDLVVVCEEGENQDGVKTVSASENVKKNRR